MVAPKAGVLDPKSPPEEAAGLLPNNPPVEVLFPKLLPVEPKPGSRINRNAIASGRAEDLQGFSGSLSSIERNY